MNTYFNELVENINHYKRKYYMNVLLKGILLFTAISVSLYLLVSGVEYVSRLNSTLRLTLLFGFTSFLTYAFVKWIVYPIYYLKTIHQQLSHEEAARQIGLYFPHIKDGLLNTLQLSQLANNELAQAHIHLKAIRYNQTDFSSAIRLEENNKFIPWLSIPLSILLGIVFFYPQILKDSNERIIHFNKEYVEPAPFDFIIHNQQLSTYVNEDFNLEIELKGNAIPEEAFIEVEGQKIRLQKDGNHYRYTFRNLVDKQSFRIYAGGYYSGTKNILVITKPSLVDLAIHIQYPSYLNKKSEWIQNSGNLNIPEGSRLTWKIKSEHTNQAKLLINKALKSTVAHTKDETLSLEYSEIIRENAQFELALWNNFNHNPERISYTIEVSKDQFPSLKIENFVDSTTFNYITLGGYCSDDIGLRELYLFYKLENDNQENKNNNFQKISIKIFNNQLNDNILYNWSINSLNLKNGEKLLYYLEVSDNDKLHNFKKTKTGIFTLQTPSKSELKDQVEKDNQKLLQKIESLNAKSNSISKELKKLKNKIASSNNFDWQEKQKLKDLLKQQADLMKEIEDLQNENKDLKQLTQKMDQPSQELAQKMESLQKMMDELLDEDTKKLMEQLQKLLEQNIDKKELNEMLKKLETQDKELEKNIDRSLELFKQLQVEQKLEQSIHELDELQKKQEELAQKELNKNNQEELKQEQNELNKSFDELKKEQNELNELNKSLENPKDLPNVQPEMEDISQDMEKSSEEIGENDNKGKQKNQKSAADKMNSLKQKMQKAKEGMEKEEEEANIEGVRQLLQNLLKLSFEEEQLMKSFKNIAQTDPAYIELTHKQLALNEDSKMIKDSLFSLSKKAFEIQAFVNKESGLMTKYMNESVDYLKQRNPQVASSKQQLAMTSINNLTLLLSDILKQMQEQQANKPGMASGKGGKCKKPGGGKPKPGGMSDLQKQLNKQIQQAKSGQMGGKQMSEALAKMAAQQEMLRKSLQQLENGSQGNKGDAGKKLQELKKLMEETEKDIVNKNISNETLKRQEEILTRLLEAENAARERELDEQRESNTGQDIFKKIRPSFEKYQKAKAGQQDLLQYKELNFKPYYKAKINEYFRLTEK